MNAVGQAEAIPNLTVKETIGLACDCYQAATTYREGSRGGT